MKKYYINADEGRLEYFEITGETQDSFIVKLVKIRDGSKKVLDEKISRDLFDICLRTGYIHAAAA